MIEDATTVATTETEIAAVGTAAPLLDAIDYRDDRRDRDRDSHRDDRRRDDRDRRDPPRDTRKDPRDHDRDRRDPLRKDERDGDRTSDRLHESTSRAHEKRLEPEVDIRQSYPPPGASEEPTSRQDSEAPVEDGEEGETMEATNDDDAAMMAMMGLTGFGTTKGKHVEGNQGGSTDVKKMRTWRQYMNRRGGFNRPLDKIK
ncbi:hypothetical protein PHLGIDRAFT_126181 [Phlebiopsis gigantea 11061_1 CR5-6]|uniref:U4/U6.U5 small nuclear ribonucleoprotein 27kDa protein domain-containing protein n=1 Tax=Phlebiopsis gigantea (strain 11061_1 CR5-6) TaxID=745531 RepID=A0A0C3NW23_PHLG1|nr:hypothetical protein PHLGIDRAFT_126181 [Phlebiopsis gigantea 11061_1 CR5-6]